MATRARRITSQPDGRRYALLILGAGVALAGATAGQAVGPILSGAVAGTVVVTASPAVTIDTQNLDIGERVTVWGAVDSWVATTNDDGTHFSVAYENNVGDVAEINLYLLNRSARDVAAKLVLDLPASVDAQVTGGYGGKAARFRKARAGPNIWLLVVDANAAGADTSAEGRANRLSIRVRVPSDTPPGFYRVSGALMQFDG